MTYEQEKPLETLKNRETKKDKNYTWSRYPKAIPAPRKILQMKTTFIE